MAVAADPAAALAAFDAPAAAAEAWREWRTLYAALRDPSSPWPGEIEAVVRWLGPLLEQRFDDAAPRLADLRQLARLAQGHASRERFLTELTLDPPEATSDEAGAPHRDEDYLILSTIHSAKGQEWASVQVLNVVDGCIPSDMATGRAAEIEEERRLLYVAMTRAKHQLALLVPQRFHVAQQCAFGDRHVYGTLSRFVPPAVAALFDAVLPTPRTSAPPVSADAGAPAVDVAAGVRALWE
jgi:DNA helicase-2/ATP-dependent DNA helicase PcrA